jgi:diguanylate cyclase (GGDEF)-like protein
MEDGSGYEEPVQPLVSGFDRDRVAEERDRASAAHDALADERDVCAEHRDHRAERREQFAKDVDPQNAFDRSEAKRDREQSAAERWNSRDDRVASEADRILSARERSEYLVDELTGAHRRADGLFELERDVLRAKRTGQPFTLAFVDIDELKTVNDSRGHAGGDDLLVLVADTIRVHVRPDDLIVRYGGDEFLCGLLGLSIVEATRRFDLVSVQLAASYRSSVTAGLAEMADPESLSALIRRADEDLQDRRKQRRDTSSRWSDRLDFESTAPQHPHKRRSRTPTSDLHGRDI